MHWYVIHTKPRQEQRALLNLEVQGYQCFLPLIRREAIRQGMLDIHQEPLFSRYLFIFLDSTRDGKSWGPIRSTLGVSKLLTFGTDPARIDSQLIDLLRMRTEGIQQAPIKLHQPGDRVTITEGPFAGIEGVFEMADGESRAMVLIELLSKVTRLKLPIKDLTKVD
jgi:transcriptional antiterminator RfaH